MQGVVKKWGNSAAVRIPASVLEMAEFALDDAVAFRVEDGRIIIEKVRPGSRYSIADLVAGISDENRHDAVEFGQAVGGEAW